MSSLLNKFLQNANQNCIPLITTIEITQNCNFKCQHCYNFDRTKEIPLPLKENTLTPDEILRAIDSVAEAGALYLNLSGGEVLMHPHLLDFVRRGKSHNLEVRLKTNGSLLSVDRCVELDKSGLGGMDISLYGFSDESYDRLTARQGMFIKATEGILNAKNAGLDVSVSIILHRYNLDEISEMKDFCESHELNYQFSTEITERYDGSIGAREFEITAEQFSSQLEGPFQELFKHFNAEKSLQCSCARSVCGISSTGEVYPCIGAPIPSGNLREQSFNDIWNNSPVLEKIRNLKTEDFKSCQTCDHIEYCNRSSGSIYSNTKNYTGCDPVTFQQAKIRHNFEMKN